MEYCVPVQRISLYADHAIQYYIVEFVCAFHVFSLFEAKPIFYIDLIKLTLYVFDYVLQFTITALMPHWILFSLFQ